MTRCCWKRWFHQGPRRPVLPCLRIWFQKSVFRDSHFDMFSRWFCFLLFLVFSCFVYSMFFDFFHCSRCFHVFFISFDFFISFHFFSFFFGLSIFSFLFPSFHLVFFLLKKPLPIQTTRNFILCLVLLKTCQNWNSNSTTLPPLPLLAPAALQEQHRRANHRLLHRTHCGRLERGWVDPDLLNQRRLTT